MAPTAPSLILPGADWSPPAEETEPGYRRMIQDVPVGITHLARHCTAPGEIEAIAPQHAPWRVREYALFASSAVAGWCAAAGVAMIGYREVQRLWWGAAP